MASESFKEDPLQGRGSFVEKPGKGEVRMAGSSKWGCLPGRREAARSHRRTCTLHREPQRGPVCAHRGWQAWAYVWMHVCVHLCIRICMCSRVCKYEHMCLCAYLCTSTHVFAFVHALVSAHMYVSVYYIE